jgi:hypothetical protein
MHIRWTREHYDNLQELVAEGKTEGAALRELGIPKGSLGNLKKRFAPSQNGGTEVREESSIGGLAQELNTYTEGLLDLAAEMSELTKAAHQLVLLDKTLGKLEARQQEAAGLRRRLGEAEKRLIARASVVHSND